MTCRHLRFSQWAESCNVLWIVAVGISMWKEQGGCSIWSASGVCGRRQAKLETTTTAHETWRARCEDDYFARHKCYLLTSWLMSWTTREKSRVRKCDVCVGLVWCLFTLSVAYKSIDIAFKRNTLQLGPTNSLCVPNRCLPPFVWWLPPRRGRAGWGCRKIPFPSRFRVTSCCSFVGTWERLIFSLPFLFDGVDFGVSFTRLFVQSNWSLDSCGFGVVFAFVHRTVFHSTVEYQYPTVFTSAALFCCGHACNFVAVRAESFVLSGRKLWLSVSWTILESCQYGGIFLFLCLLSRSVSCVKISLSLSISMTCAVWWTFVYYVVRNR